jgi:serine/threonine protein phosphatase PrpC
VSALKLQARVVSEVGLRENNEDSAFVSTRLLAVADGVGGAAAGEIASRLAIGKICALGNRRIEHPLDRELYDALADANAVIAFAIFYDPERDGMGTTLTAVALSNDGHYLVANIGDSRTYLLRDGRLRRLTRDQTLVQALIDQGALSERDARGHPQRSVVLEALDGVERPLPPLHAIQAKMGDRLLLCSDGVTDYLSDLQIAKLLAIEDAALSVRELVSSALRHGSRDNVTAIVADVVVSQDPRDRWLDVLPPPGKLE